MVDIRTYTVVVLFCSACTLLGETGYDAWLRYRPIDDPNVRQSYEKLPATVTALGSSAAIKAAQDELSRGVRGMLEKTLRVQSDLPDENSILLGTLDSVKRVAPDLALPQTLVEDAYILKTTAAKGHSIVLITASNDRGVLYGTFALLRKLALHQEIDHFDEQSTPYAPIRWTN